MDNNIKQGFSLVEVILAISIFVLILFGASSVFVYGQNNNVSAGKRTQAVLLADEAFEVVHNIREADFNNLVDGTYGLSNSSGSWELVNSEESINSFNREIIISTINDNVKSVRVEIDWPQDLQRSGNISVSQYFSNWQTALEQTFTSCKDYCRGNNYTVGVCRKSQDHCIRTGGFYEVEGDQYCDKDKKNICCCK